MVKIQFPKDIQNLRLYLHLPLKLNWPLKIIIIPQTLHWHLKSITIPQTHHFCQIISQYQRQPNSRGKSNLQTKNQFYCWPRTKLQRMYVYLELAFRQYLAGFWVLNEFQILYKMKNTYRVHTMLRDIKIILWITFIPRNSDSSRRVSRQNVAISRKVIISRNI